MILKLWRIYYIQLVAALIKNIILVLKKMYLPELGIAAYSNTPPLPPPILYTVYYIIKIFSTKMMVYKKGGSTQTLG